MESSQAPVIFRARLHYGPPLFGHILALALIAVTGVVRIAVLKNGDFHMPFFLFYPAIAVAAFLGGAGPGLMAITAGAVFGYFFYPAFPNPGNWIAIAVLGPLMATGFAHLREVSERSIALAREFSRFKFISEHVSDWIFLTKESGEVEYANQTACTQTGWSNEELNGRLVEHLVPDWQKPTLRDMLSRCKPGVAVPAEITLERRDRSLVAVEVVCTGVRVAEEVVIHIAARDITERRQIEQKLRDARHWESLGVMAGGLAHDFNNLLTSIMGNAALAKESLPGDHPLASLLDSIQNAGDRSAELVRMMLATAGYRTRHRERLRLDRMLNAILAAHVIPAGVRVATRVEAPVFTGDESSIDTLLWSLISNAVESYGDSPGEVIVAIESGCVPDLPPGDFEEGDAGSGHCIRIIVEDKGSGIEPAVLARAFDPFFSTKFTGRGLGLPAVRGLVRAYKGKLWVKTKPGEGTRVEVWLPAAAQATTAASGSLT